MKSEFQRILEEKISGRKSGAQAADGTEVARDAATDGRTEKGSSPSTADFLTWFTFSGPQTQPATRIAYSFGARPESSPESPKVVPVKTVRPQPKPRIKRHWSFDQTRALRIFVKYGEPSMDDFSTDDEIRAAYRRLAKKFHPDQSRAATEEIFKVVAGAYRKLVA